MNSELEKGDLALYDQHTVILGGGPDDERGTQATQVASLAAPTDVIGYLSEANVHGSCVAQPLVYTAEEEGHVVRVLDTRLLPWILLITTVMGVDQSNLGNAISDNLPQDLGFNINVVNTSSEINTVLFSLACFAGAIVGKRVGLTRCMPILMLSWGLVTASQALIRDEAGFLITRSVITITEAFFHPLSIVYLSEFYRVKEMGMRLSWLAGVQIMAMALSGLLGSAIFRLRGVAGLSGWKWLFIIEGAITVIIAILTWFYLPINAASTKGGIRGRSPWFTEREVQIAVTRLRNDHSEQSKERVTLTDCKNVFSNVGLWGHLILTVVSMTPLAPMYTYLPFIIRSFNFDVFASNALVAPPCTLQVATSVLFQYHSDRVSERGYHGAFAALWMAVGWILLRTLPSAAGRGVKYFAVCVVASCPSSGPLNIAWALENTETIGKRTVVIGAMVAATRIFPLWASQIYQAKDAPDFKVGNVINIAFSGTAIILWFVQKSYYKYRNRKNREKLAELSEDGLKVGEKSVETVGDARPLFEFTT